MFQIRPRQSQSATVPNPTSWYILTTAEVGDGNCLSAPLGITGSVEYAVRFQPCSPLQDYMLWRFDPDSDGHYFAYNKGWVGTSQRLDIVCPKNTLWCYTWMGPSDSKYNNQRWFLGEHSNGTFQISSLGLPTGRPLISMQLNNGYVALMANTTAVSDSVQNWKLVDVSTLLSSSSSLLSATSSSPPGSPSASRAPPSAQFSSTTPQPSYSPSMVTSTSSTNPLANPTTFQTTTSVQDSTSSSASQSAPRATNKNKIGIAVGVPIAFSTLIICFWLCWLCWLSKKAPRIRRLRAMKSNNEWKKMSSEKGESLQPKLVHVTTKDGKTYDCHAILDTGADSNFISLDQLRKFGYDKEDLTPSQVTWNALGNPNLPSLGLIELTWTTDNKTEPGESVKFYVFDHPLSALVLGKPFISEKDLIRYNPKAWTVTRNQEMSQEERERQRHANEDQARRNLAGRDVSWDYEAATKRYFFIDTAGKKVYQNQGGGSTGGSRDSGAQGQNPGESS